MARRPGATDGSKYPAQLTFVTTFEAEGELRAWAHLLREYGSTIIRQTLELGMESMRTAVEAEFGRTELARQVDIHTTRAREGLPWAWRPISARARPAATIPPAIFESPPNVEIEPVED